MRLWVSSSLFCVVLVLFCTTGACAGGDRGPAKSLRRSLTKGCTADLSHYISLIIQHLRKAVGFYQQFYHQCNLDGLFGLQFAEGNLRRALESRTRFKHRSRYIREIAKLHRAIAHVINLVKPEVKRVRPKYYEHFAFLFEKPLQVSPKVKRYRKSLLWRAKGSTAEYNEAFGDHCMAAVAGTGHHKQRCRLTRGCLNFLKTKNRHEYYLTHQLLLLIVTENVGCKRDLQKVLGTGGFQELYERLCSNIHAEMLHMSRNQIKFSQRDLFLEQNALTAMANFERPCKLRWLKEMLSWQSKSGCLPMSNKMSTSRRKRTIPKNEDTEMGAKGENCSSHTTGLAVAVYTSYLSWIYQHPRQAQRQARELCQT